jgi:hypothetical protein
LQDPKILTLVIRALSADTLRRYHGANAVCNGRRERMVSEYPAPQIHFAGLGAEGQTAAEAAEGLAAALRQWTSAHEECRVLQISVTPALGTFGTSPSPRFGVTAIVVYVETALTQADAAHAVAAALEEIHEAQTGDPERRMGDGPGRTFV